MQSHTNKSQIFFALNYTQEIHVITRIPEMTRLVCVLLRRTQLLLKSYNTIWHHVSVEIKLTSVLLKYTLFANMEDISKLRMKECSKLMEILKIPDDDVENVEQARAELNKAKMESQVKAGWSPGKVRHYVMNSWQSMSTFSEPRIY